MKVRIKNADCRFTLILPTNLIFGKWVVWLANGVARKYAPEAMAHISPEALDALFGEFRRIKKKHGSWELVNVESSDGDLVKIIL